jgi:uncharacterized protein (DUF924 family)
MLHHSRTAREQLALVLVVEQLGRVFFRRSSRSSRARESAAFRFANRC